MGELAICIISTTVQPAIYQRSRQNLALCLAREGKVICGEVNAQRFPTRTTHMYAPEPISPSLQFQVNIFVKRQRNHQHHHLLEPVGKVFAMRPCRRRDSKNSKTEIIYTQKTDKNTNAQMIPGSPLEASISEHRMQGQEGGKSSARSQCPPPPLRFPRTHTHTVLRNPGSSANAVRARLQRTNSPALNNCNNQMCVHCAGHKCKKRLKSIADNLMR